MYNSNSAREIESFRCLMLNVHKKASLLSTFIISPQEDQIPDMLSSYKL